MSFTNVLKYGILSQGGLAFPTSGLVHYWRLDETAGSTVYDSVGSLNATVYNATINQTGIKNRSVYFDNNSESIGFGNTNVIAYNEAFSVSMWVKRINIANGGIYFAKYNTSSNVGYQLWSNGTGDINILLRNGSGYRGMNVAANTISSTTIWYNIVWTYTGSVTSSGFEIYCNGIKQTHATNWDVGTLTTIATTYNFYIGNRHTGSSLSANGYVDEVAQWNRALTETEAISIYNSGTGLFY